MSCRRSFIKQSLHLFLRLLRCPGAAIPRLYQLGQPDEIVVGSLSERAQIGKLGRLARPLAVQRSIRIRGRGVRLIAALP